ncbi:amidohydrolase 2 [Thelephora ganbajun]|uniref:Amidohydrolase 2 n=1 Tax=Thelephora ganbajun TaxID=370292 RepID=A0ACB6ZSQ2_THEGA|nr:amidohydrolase 2 [Thelephora ganbajun]
MSLRDIVFNYPAIDNHAHPLLKEEYRRSLPFEGVISEARPNAIGDAIHSLPGYRAARQIAELYGLDPGADWEEIKSHRDTLEYDQLCDMNMQKSGIQCLFLDDGLRGVQEMANDLGWHGRFTNDSVYRLVRIESIAEDILKSLPPTGRDVLVAFASALYTKLRDLARDPVVVGFKSVVAYRTGLSININSDDVSNVERSIVATLSSWKRKAKGSDVLRLADKPLNDFVVRTALSIATEFNKPVQFHTGLGDPDVILTLSSPAQMQPIIEAYPKVTFILLHGSYPYSRDAGYLASTYQNVYVDFGEVFPVVSRHGQYAVVKQLLEMTPISKIVWSTDGHWWPETFYLAAIQTREVLYEVLSEFIQKGDMSERQAISLTKKALFENANKVYNLGLKRVWEE